MALYVSPEKPNKNVKCITLDYSDAIETHGNWEHSEQNAAMVPGGRAIMATSVQLKSVYNLSSEACDINSLTAKLFYYCNQRLQSVCSRFYAIKNSLSFSETFILICGGKKKKVYELHFLM